MPTITVLCTHNFACTNVRTEPFYMHQNQCTQIWNLLSAALNLSESSYELAKELFDFWWDLTCGSPPSSTLKTLLQIVHNALSHAFLSHANCSSHLMEYKVSNFDILIVQLFDLKQKNID